MTNLTRTPLIPISRFSYPAANLGVRAKPIKAHALSGTNRNCAIQRRLLVLLWFWVCRLGRAHECAGGKVQICTVLTARIAIVIILSFMRGSVAGKSDLLRRLLRSYVEQRKALYAKLRAAYIIWRQRKCWMWGGGFMTAVSAMSAGCINFVRDRTSFDALIPD